MHLPKKISMKNLIVISKCLLFCLATISFGLLNAQTNTVVFDGKGSYLDLPASMATDAEGFTFETWLYYSGAQRWARVLDFGNDAKTHMFLTTSPDASNKPRFLINKAGKTEFVNSKTALQIGKWHHLAIVFQDKNFRMYLNGEPVAEKNFTVSLADLGPLANKWIGRSHYSWDDYLKAKLAEVRIWNVARSATEIKEGMNCTLEGSEEGLSALYQFKIWADSIAVDTKGGTEGILRGTEAVPGLEENEQITNLLKDCSEIEETTTTLSNTLSFDGKGDYVSLANPPFYTNSFSIETWMKPTGKAAGTIFNVKDQTNKSALFLMFNGSGQLRFCIRNPAGVSGGLEIVSNTAFTDNAWHHIAAVKGEDDKTYLYVDGKLEKTSTRTISDFASPQAYEVLLGANIPGGAERFYTGLMDELRIWKSAKSAEYIASNYKQALTGTESGLHAYYKFDQGLPGGNNAGQTALKDELGNANGSLKGFALTGDQSNFIASDLTMEQKEVAVVANHALHMDGDKDFVDATATATGLPQGREPRTMEAWVKTKQTSIGNILSWGRRVARMRNSMAVRSGKLAYIGQSLDFMGKTPINDGVWHHLALSYDGENWSIYVDGKLDGQHGADPNTTDQNLKIGNISDPSNGEYFHGTMDELRVWNVARTAEEIAANRTKELTGQENGLVAYYNFNQGIAGGDNPTVSTLTDQAGENDATLVDFSLSGDVSNWVASTSAIQSSSAKELEKVQILGARWGIGNDMANCTAEVQVLAESPRTPFKVQGSNLGTDPKYGHTKELTVAYQIKDAFYLRQMKDHTMFDFFGASTNAPIVIHKAIWGKGDHQSDCKEQLQKIVDHGAVGFRSQGTVLGKDPLYGTKKTLKLIYEVGGETFEKEIPDHQEFYFTTTAENTVRGLEAAPQD